jgi:hypothetical protein
MDTMCRSDAPVRAWSGSSENILGTKRCTAREQSKTTTAEARWCQLLRLWCGELEQLLLIKKPVAENKSKQSWVATFLKRSWKVHGLLTKLSIETCNSGWLRGPEPESRWNANGNRTDWLRRLGTEQQAKTQLMCKEEAHVILNNKHRKLHP